MTVTAVALPRLLPLPMISQLECAKRCPVAKQTILPEIIRVIGEDAAQKLLAQKGGARIRIPARMKHEHWLANLIGQDLAIGSANISHPAWEPWR
jgi:hypothetical protein